MPGRVIKKIATVPNQHFAQTQNILAASPFMGGTSAARKQMVGNNLGQIVVVSGIQEQWIQTGMDTNLADTTFSQKMPVDGQILAVVPLYRSKQGMNEIKYSPQTIVLFRASNPQEAGYDIGMVELTGYSSYHPYLGFNYVSGPAQSKLAIDSFISKGAVFRDSPGVMREPGSDEGDYQFSVPVPIAMMSIPEVAEDGIVVSESLLQRFGFSTFERRVVSFGNMNMPLNIYCRKDENGLPLNGEYKIHPDIGEKVRPDGVLMALRTYEPHLALVEQNVRSTMSINYFHDECVYADGEVIDIRIHHDLNTGMAGTPPTMEEQPLKYDNARREFYAEIFNLYHQWIRPNMFGPKVRLMPQLHQLIVQAISVITPSPITGQTVSKVYKKSPLDDYRYEFTIENRQLPNNGKKFTDFFGGKGVTVRVWKDEDMPVDSAGNRAQMIFDSAAVINRMIPGRLNQQYMYAAIRDMLVEVIRRLGVDKTKRRSLLLQDLTTLERSDPARFQDAWEYLLGFYEIINPTQANMFRNRERGSTPVSHLAYIISKGYAVIYMPTDHEMEQKNMISDIERLYPPVFGPVTYRGASGEMVTTVNDIRIGPMPIIMLEKLADGWSAVSSSRRQHHGVPATLSNNDKHSSRIRNQPTKSFGETEIRLVVSYSGQLAAAEILDRNNNTLAHQAIVDAILTSDYPTRITEAVDRTKVRLGGSSPLQMINHVASCSGYAFDWKPYVPRWTAPASPTLHA